MAKSFISILFETPFITLADVYGEYRSAKEVRYSTSETWDNLAAGTRLKFVKWISHREALFQFLSESGNGKTMSGTYRYIKLDVTRVGKRNQQETYADSIAELNRALEGGKKTWYYSGRAPREVNPKDPLNIDSVRKERPACVVVISSGINVLGVIPIAGVSVNTIMSEINTRYEMPYTLTLIDTSNNSVVDTIHVATVKRLVEVTEVQFS